LGVVVGFTLEGGRHKADPRHFAKAFWGEDWEYHHGQLIHHRDDPLAYLARFL
jgi:hypothetical protein